MAKGELRKLNKTQRSEVFHLFVEGVSVPMLVLATTVLFAAIALNETSNALVYIISIFLAALAMPMLAISIFVRRAVAIVGRKSAKVSAAAENCEVFGGAASFGAFVAFLISVYWPLCIATIIGATLGACMNYKYLKDARN